MALGSGPVERKVTAASAGAVITALLIWLFDTYVFNGTGTPEPVANFIQLGVLAGGTFVSGWLAKHTPRSDVSARGGA